MRVLYAALIVILAGTGFGRAQGGDATRRPLSSASEAETRGVAYLAREVPAWRREHPCYSCHNNGDAARALIAAEARKHTVRAALEDTLTWLEQPHRWESNGGGEGGGDDKRLARIQFAHAVSTAFSSGMVGPDAVRAAAGIVAADQQEDGSWQLDSSDSIGSPATYGTALATVYARRTLSASRLETLTPHIDLANRWLRTVAPRNLPDAAAVILAFVEAPSGDRPPNWATALALIAKGQGSNGGWGPYLTSQAEAFDTSLALLALQEVRTHRASAAPAFTADALSSAIQRGRQYLVQQQFTDGSWPETTRPAGQASYAQRISTTAWALLALMTTDQGG